MRIRTIKRLGETWANVEDIRKALNDDELIERSAAMIKVGADRGDPPFHRLKMAITYFFTEGTGILEALRKRV